MDSQTLKKNLVKEQSIIQKLDDKLEASGSFETAESSKVKVHETGRENTGNTNIIEEGGKEANHGVMGEVKSKEKQKIVKKSWASAKGNNLRISKKHSMEILRFLKGRKIDEMIEILENVLKKKQAIPFKGYEIPHRKRGVSGRYPRNASLEILKILKSLRANAGIANVDLATAVLSGKANDASRQFKRGGSMRFKRTHVEVWVKEHIHAEKVNEVKK